MSGTAPRVDESYEDIYQAVIDVLSRMTPEQISELIFEPYEALRKGEA